MIKRIGHYEVMEKIGEGAMGIVYKAQDPRRFNRIVAIKTIKDQHDPDTLEQFIKEAEILAKLYHQNLIQIHDVGEFDEDGIRKPYLVMEFLFGRNLQDIIKGREPLSVDRKLTIIIQACRGLHAAHEAGLIHRDIKPSNVFVLEDDFVKIIDFGIARASSAEITFAWKGTPYYMSPEQIDLKEAPSRRSDIFSLGVVFYELLTYTKPFPGKTTQEIFAAILSRSFIPRPIRELDPSIDDRVCKVVEKALAKDPRRRFSTAREMAEFLEKIRRGEYIEVFDLAKIQARIHKATKAAADGNFAVAESILQDLQAEGFSVREIAELEESIQKLRDARRIADLMKTASDLIHAEEYLLALEKLEDALRINAQDEQALALKVQVSEKLREQELARWLRRAEVELERNNLAQAADALDRALQIDAQSRQAQALSRQLAAAQQLQATKNRLLSEFQLDWKSGHLDAALAKASELVTLDSAQAEYRALYNKLQAEKAEVDARLMEGRRLLAQKAFTEAAALAQSVLSRYPGQPDFSALLADIERAREEEKRNDIAALLGRAEKAGRVEDQLAVLTEGLEKYPGEPELSARHERARERKAQIDALWREADELENDRQFSEAIARVQKAMVLAGGREAEGRGRLAELQQKLDEQKRQDFKQAQIAQMSQHIKAGVWDAARQALQAALEALPADPDLERWRAEIDAQIQRARAAAELKARGQERLRSGRFTEAIDLFDQALKIDPSDAVLVTLREEAKKQKEAADRPKLIANLLRQAEELIESGNLTLAGPIVEHLLKLDAPNPAVRRLADTIDVHKRETAKERYITAKLSEATALARDGTYDRAERVLEEAAAIYADSRLVELLAELRKEKETMPGRQYQTKTRTRPPEAARRKRRAVLDRIVGAMRDVWKRMLLGLLGVLIAISAFSAPSAVLHAPRRGPGLTESPAGVAWVNSKVTALCRRCVFSS